MPLGDSDGLFGFFGGALLSESIDMMEGEYREDGYDEFVSREFAFVQVSVADIAAPRQCGFVVNFDVDIDFRVKSVTTLDPEGNILDLVSMT